MSALADGDIRDRVLRRSVEEWESLLNSGEGGVHRSTAQELYSFRKQLVELLPDLMKSSSARVRIAAVTAFHGLRMREVEGVLVAALSDPEALVRETAYRGLMIQGPHTLGTLREYIDGLPAPPDSRMRLGPFWTGEGHLPPVDWLPDGDSLSIPVSGGDIEIWDWRENSRLRTLELQRDTHFLRWSPDGRWLATTGGPFGLFGCVYVWASQRTEWIEPNYASNGSTCISWAPDSKEFAYGAAQELIVVSLGGEVVLRMDFGERLRDVKFDPTGRWIGACTEGGRVFVVEAARGSRHLCPEVKGIWLSWAPDGRSFLCTGKKAAAMYSLAERRVEWERSGRFTLGVGGGVFCSDGARIVLVASSRIELVHAGTGASLRAIKDPQRVFDNPRCSPSGRYVAVSDGMSNVWLMDTLPPVRGQGEDPRPLEDQLWLQLESMDMDTGLEAENEIAGAGSGGAEFIAARVGPVPPTSLEEVKGLAVAVVAGGEDASSARERLAELGPAAADLLRSFNAEEMGSQVELLVPWLLDQRVSAQTCRALSALARSRSKASTAVLERLAEGQRRAPLTELARSFLRMSLPD